jgi:alginate biosynthesis protein Alg44
MGSMTYDAELQSQHPRYHLPMRARINGTSYNVRYWSMNGFAIDATSFASGEMVNAILSIPFEGYDFSLTIPSQVFYSSDPMKHTSFVFLELDNAKASLLQYVTDALLSGEVVRAGDILDVARRDNSTHAHQIPTPLTATLGGRLSHVGRRFATSLGVIAIGAALSAFLFANVYDRLYVVRSQSASVSAKTVNIAAPAIGRISFLNQKSEVALGEPLMTINPAIGNPITIESPCNCLQVDQRFTNGDFVKVGEPILRLLRADSPIVVSAIVPPDKIMSLYGVKTASITYADGSMVNDANILWLPGKGEDKTQLPRDTQTVVIDPGREISTSMLGQPVNVKFNLIDTQFFGSSSSLASDGALAVSHNAKPGAKP